MTKDQIPARDILAIVAAPDGASVVAVHDRTTYRLDVVCSACSSPFTLLLSRGCTDDDINRHRAAFAAAADKHADTRHTPRPGREGGQQ